MFQMVDILALGSTSRHVERAVIWPPDVAALGGCCFISRLLFVCTVLVLLLRRRISGKCYHHGPPALPTHQAGEQCALNTNPVSSPPIPSCCCLLHAHSHTFSPSCVACWLRVVNLVCTDRWPVAEAIEPYRPVPPSLHALQPGALGRHSFDLLPCLPQNPSWRPCAHHRAAAWNASSLAANETARHKYTSPPTTRNTTTLFHLLSNLSRPNSPNTHLHQRRYNPL